MASSSQSERKGLKEDQETESSISKTIQRVGRGGDVDVELGLDGGARGEGLADERSFRRTSRDKVFSSSSLFLRLSQRPFYPGERLKASTTKYQVLGTSRYLLSVERQTCWKSQCTLENGTMGRPLCKPRFLIVACQANQNVKAGLVSQSGRCHRYLSLRRRVMGRRVLTSTAQDVDVSPAAIAFASVEMEI
ncbi:hypothetical protein MUK42_33308 [Musa troglodytarum]|uniref:Uncharacterized protein n=1 Tax=Musa troglodytarum TaxID=320322 RepID=A0A9E7L8I8_9LILI|nr:hypothetical protein MUK42_33308 [Musa troglodytarum]